jgi:chorismate mutase
MKRWQTILNSRLEMGRKLGLDESFLMDLLRMIHNESIQKQTEIMNNPDDKEEK